MKLKGKTALITGAGRGIGKATALLFAEEGADIVVADLEYSEAQETAAEIKTMECPPSLGFWSTIRAYHPLKAFMTQIS